METTMDPGAAEVAGAAAVGGVMMLFWLAVVVLMVVSLWKIFAKAGEPGWAAIVPVYNTIVMLKIAGKPLWWIILMFIPVVNFVIWIMMLAGIANNFGKGVGFVLGLIFLPFIFYPMLAFGSAQYRVAQAQ